MKKAVIITLDGKIVEAVELTTYQNDRDFYTVKEEAQRNKKELLNDYEKTIKTLNDVILSNKKQLLKELNLLKLEIKLLKGEIDDDIYFEKKAEIEKEI